MAGGQWDSQNKILPGVYINMKTASEIRTETGERGIVAIARQLSWGESGSYVTIKEQGDALALLGYDIGHSSMLFLREILRGSAETTGANTVYVYRLKTTGETVAQATVGNVVAKAKYPGLRGNDITISITADLDTELATDGEYACFTVRTFVDGSLMAEQYVGTFASVTDNTPATVADLTANTWVDWSGTGAIAASAGIPLVGGTDGTVTASSYSEFLAAIEPIPFNVVIYDDTDAVTKAAFVSFVKRLSFEKGIYCQCVLSNYKQANTETCISVKNGFMMADEVDSSQTVTLTPEQATWWVGGATAGANYNQSLTYAIHPLATEAVPAYTNSELQAALSAGELILFSEWGNVKVLQDINSLTSLTLEKGKAFKKNRVVRVLFTIANDIYQSYSLNYIGKIDNNSDGRNLLKADIVGYLNNIQANNGIQNFTKDDVTVEAGNDVDSVVITVAIQAVDSVEKIYMTVVVS